MEAKKDISEVKKRLKKQFDEMMDAKEGSWLYPRKLFYQEFFRTINKAIKLYGEFFADAKATCKETASTINEHYKIEPDTEKFTKWLCDYVDWQILENGIPLTEINIEDALIAYAKKRKKDIEDKINVGITVGLNGIYDDKTLEAIFDRLKDLGWFKGKKSHFVAIFKPEPLPQDWQPIEYTKMYGTKPHKTALAALVYLIYPKNKAGYVWSGFTVNKKTFEIDKNRDSYTGIETHELKGIELKLK